MTTFFGLAGLGLLASVLVKLDRVHKEVVALRADLARRSGS
jgi:hypothetical protein